MKVQNKTRKSSFFKKLFIKFCRFFDYEIVDQGDLSFPTTNKKGSKNLSNLGIQSLVLPMGRIKIKRPIRSLDIILRTCASVNMLTQSKKRIFKSNKEDYSLKTLKSLINSINYNKKIFKNIKVKLTIIDHNSNPKVIEKFKKLLKKQFFKSEILNLNINFYKNIIQIYMANNFLNTNYSFILNNTFDCGSVSDIKPALIDSNNHHPNSETKLPKFSPGTYLFTTPGRIWCMNSENQSNCIPDENYILKPKYDQNFSNDFQYGNNLKYSNNILSNINNSVEKINIGKKYDSTGTNINNTNTYTDIDTSNNPYPSNINFTPDNVSFSQLNQMNMEKVSACNNRSIENRFRPVYLHVPDQVLEICEPVGYESKNNAKKY